MKNSTKTLLVIIAVIAIVVITLFITRTTTSPKAEILTAEQPTSIITGFAWRYEKGSNDADGLPQTQIFLDTTHTDGKVTSIKIDEVQGSCNTIDAAKDDKDIVSGTTKIQCYAAGMGEWYKIVKAEKAYEVRRKYFEETSPDMTPTNYQYETIVTIPNNESVIAAPTISSDKKDILKDGKVLLSVDDSDIFEYVKKAENGLCDSSNINTTPTRKSFCTSKTTFRAEAFFTKIVVSPTNNAIGFTIQTTELSPDSVAGIFLRLNTTYKVHLLTNYYLGNDFSAFAPSGSRFAFTEKCFEGNCGFTIMTTNTLTSVKHFGNSETGPNYVFVRWINDSTIEYKLDGTTKQTSI
ncbi:MAG: hypothetical protein ABIO57_03430 [Candidatus Paceibacterota bacterium]